MSEQPDLRIGTPERDHALDVLSDRFTNGYLDIQEFERRTAAAVSATHRSQLTELLADLPPINTTPAGVVASENKTEVSGSKSAMSSESELADIRARGKKVAAYDAVIWSITIATMFVCIFADIDNWWVIFPIAAMASWGVRGFFNLDGSEEKVYSQLEKQERDEREARLKQAMKRRQELGR